VEGGIYVGVLEEGVASSAIYTFLRISSPDVFLNPSANTFRQRVSQRIHNELLASHPHHEMKSFIAIVACASIAFAHPSPSNSTEPAANTTEVNASYLVKSTAANCQPGLNYCFEQIVKDLRASCSFTATTFLLPLNTHPYSSTSIFSSLTVNRR
jgi:hypothetical protein